MDRDTRLPDIDTLCEAQDVRDFIRRLVDTVILQISKEDQARLADVAHRLLEAELGLSLEGVPPLAVESYRYDWKDLGSTDFPVAVVQDGRAVVVGYREDPDPDHPVLVVDLDRLDTLQVSEPALQRLRDRFRSQYPYRDG